jgi:Bacterial type III secretion protein (HrpB1_HrpK)
MTAGPAPFGDAPGAAAALQADIGLGLAGRSLRGAASPELLERLAEVGFLASECGLHAAAESIFANLTAMKPGSPSPLIGAAMVRARRGEVDAAIEQLRGVVLQHADSEMAKAMLGTLLVHAERPGALPLFEEVLATQRDSGAVNVVQCCIEPARKLEQAAPSAGS